MVVSPSGLVSETEESDMEGGWRGDGGGDQAPPPPAPSTPKSPNKFIITSGSQTVKSLTNRYEDVMGESKGTYAIGGTSSECCVLLFPIGVVLLPFRAEHCGSAHRHNLIILTLGILFEVVSGFSGDVFSCFWVDSVIGVVVLGVPGDDIVDTFSCCSCVISIFS